MPQDESPEKKYEHLQKRLQEEILKNYPNPERKGCPPKSVLEELAARPFDRPIEEDANWEHATHCSECYREFLGIQAASRQSKKIRQESFRWVLAGVAAIFVLAILFFGRGWMRNASKRPQNAELAAYRPITIDIDSITRSANGSGERKPIYLYREREELRIQLPVGSKAGAYEFRLRDQANQTVVTQSAAATISAGVTAFVVRVDLSRLAVGQYRMEVRQIGWDWDYVPVVVR
jgi:hypothetical protein